MGNPLLATWDADGVIRTYEYTSGAFVQLGALGGFPHAISGEIPYLQWFEGDSYLAIARSVSTATNVVESLTSLAVKIATYTGPENTDHGYIVASEGVRNSMLVSMARYYAPGGTINLRVNYDGTISYFNVALQSGNIERRAASVDGFYILQRYTNGLFDFVSRVTSPEVLNATFQLESTPPFLIEIDMFAWATNNRTLIGISTGLKRAQSWIFNGDAWSLVHEIPLPAGDLRDIAVSPDTRHIAISTFDSGTYRTRIYRRTGDFVVEHQNFTGIGAMLEFTADGKLLVDSQLRAALLKSDTDVFSSANSAMVNLPIGILSQALSFGRIDTYSIATLYDTGLSAFASNSVDLNNLKLTLLTTDAVFDPSDLTLSEVTNSGAWEVVQGGWPSGGILMENVISESSPGAYSLTCDPLERITIVSGLSFRYALVYDATSGLPLIWLDATQEKFIARNRKLQIEFRGGAFLKFST